MGTAVRNVCIFESDFMNIFYFLKYINGGYMWIYKWWCIVVNTGKGKGEWNWGSQIWTILRIYLACLNPFTPVLPLALILSVGVKKAEEMSLEDPPVTAAAPGTLDSPLVYRHILPPPKFEDVKFARKFSLPIPVSDHKEFFGNTLSVLVRFLY